MNREKCRRRWWDLMFYSVLCIAAFLIIIPIIFVVLSSFKDEVKIFSDPWALPVSWNFDNYIALFEQYDMGVYFRNSLFYALAGCLVCLVLSFPASYALCRMRWKTRGFFQAYLLAGLMVPIHSIVIPLYIIICKIPVSNRFALVLIYAVTTLPTALFLFIGNLKSLPISIEEAAVIDGCSLVQVLLRIVIPLSRGAIASVVIFSFLNIWNDMMLALIFLGDNLDKTIQIGIMRFQGGYYTNYPLLLSAISMAIIPMMILFFFMSRQIISGVTVGAIKE